MRNGYGDKMRNGYVDKMRHLNEFFGLWIKDGRGPDADWRTRTGGRGLADADWRTRTDGRGMADAD
jgi:hypothetical protein